MVNYDGEIEWKVILFINRTENSVKNKFYGCVRKFVRKLNNI